MNNNIDRQYKELLDYILHFGNVKKDRTGTGTQSIFGWHIRHRMSEGFPLLTTKKMAWKGIVSELIWFLRGETNIQYLVKNGNYIWVGDAYKNYTKKTSANSSEFNQWMRDNGDGTLSMYTQKEFIEKIKTDDEFAAKWGDLGPIYGKQWRDWGGQKEVLLTDERTPEGYLKYEQRHIAGIDQIANVIRDLKNNPDSRRIMVNAWNVAEIDQAVLPPCHYGFQFYTRELTLEERKNLVPSTVPNLLTHEDCDTINLPKRAISLAWNQRSVDTFLGLPFNIASYALLLSIVAEIVNMVPEDLIGFLGDTHLYLNHLEQAREQMTRAPYELPKLNINPEFWAPGTEDGCGMGPGTYSEDITGLFNSLEIGDFQIEGYQSHPKIEAPLSN
jgi:thymidylate synthase